MARPTATSPLTDEEHIARAMLLGLRYHHGNGEPFYYELGTDGLPTFALYDAETLKPLVDLHPDSTKGPRGRGIRAERMIWDKDGIGDKLL